MIQPTGISTLDAVPATTKLGEPAAGSPSFQALLERLQQFVATSQPTPEVTNVDELREAMRDADASFTTAMDLRRQLEEAFRRHLP